MPMRRAIAPLARPVLFYLVAVGACLLVYRGLADNYLYNDDFRWIRNARHDMRADNLFTFQVIGFFRPLMNVLFYLTERLHPGNLGAYYATNLLFHFLNGVLVFHLLDRWFHRRAVAAGAALLFLVTSTHWAAVGWISARTSLVSTLLVLASMLVLVGRPPSRWRRASAVLLYVLALFAKEDAVVAVALLALLKTRGDRDAATAPDRRAFVYFGAATVAYVVVRTAVIGHVLQENWGPGVHALRNLGGGFLYGVYPWSLASLTGIGATIGVQTHPWWPEILALPVLALLLVAGRVLRRREVAVGIAWMWIALFPVSMFRFRFFTTEWLTHDRYYYLSSVGACLCMAALLDGAWRVSRLRTATRCAVVAVVAVMLVGEPVAAAKRAARFHRMTSAYRSLVEVVGRRMDERSRYFTCAVQGWPMQRAFLPDVFALERPEWHVVAVADEAQARANAPCLFVRLEIHDNRLTTAAAGFE
jgi:hypothetical protein